MLRADHQADPLVPRVREAAQHPVEEGPARGHRHHRLVTALRRGALGGVERRRRIGAPHAGAEPAGEDDGAVGHPADETAPILGTSRSSPTPVTTQTTSQAIAWGTLP